LTAKRMDEETLADLWGKGKTRGEIAKLMGVSEWTVGQWAKRIGLEKKRMGRPAIAFDEGRFRRLWEGNLTIEDIADRLQMSSTNVGYHARRLGLSRRGHGRRKAVDMPTDRPAAPQTASQAAGTDLTGRLLATKGRWALLADVAKREGLTMTQAQQKFHAARVMG
jgi:DNA-binding CsgD family transcriptional regulator